MERSVTGTREAEPPEVLDAHQKVEHEMWADEKVPQFAHFFLSIVSEYFLQSTLTSGPIPASTIYSPAIVGQSLGLSPSLHSSPAKWR